VRRVVLALPVLALALYSDRIVQEHRDLPPSHTAPSLEEVYAALPARDEGRFGRPGDALNMIFLGSEPRVRAALTRAGWTSIPLTIRASIRAGLKDLMAGRPLTRFPPMNEYLVMNRIQDMNWVKVIKPIETRHHFRLWRTGIVDARGREVWWGSGNYDLSVRYRDLSHRPDPDMDRERDFLAQTLAGDPDVEKAGLLELAQIPRTGANDKGYAFRTDGRALLVELAPDAR